MLSHIFKLIYSLVLILFSLIELLGILMTFKRQFLLIVLLVLLSAILFSALFYHFKKSHFIDHEISHIYNQRSNEFQSIISTRKTLLIAIADSLTQNKEVQNAYLRNDRDILINSFEDMWKTFQKKNLISEIHFFKLPAISFVNFSNVEKYNMNVEDVRQDISWVSSSFTPSTHFLVCRLFPGLRATYPIVINNILYGSVSLGIDLHEINHYIQDTHPEVKSYFLLDDAKLQDSLLKDKYEILIKDSQDLNNYKVFGTKKKLDFINLNKKFVYKDEILYSIFSIEDFDDKIIGYFIFEDTIENFIAVLFNYTLLYILMFFFIGLTSVYIFWILLSTYNKEIQHIMNLLTALTNKDFKKVIKYREKLGSTYKELENIENKIFDTSKDIEMYIELLSKEIQDYSDKAFKDVLTETFNRRALEDIGVKMLAKNNLALKSTSIIMLDIDNFKVINDTYGHTVGDIALKHLSSHIKQIIRKDDLFVRYGGEEFVILLPNITSTSLVEVAEKIRLTIQNDVIEINNIKISFTVSLGVCESLISDIDLNDFVQKADEKLYLAKNNGKNCIII